MNEEKTGFDYANRTHFFFKHTAHVFVENERVDQSGFRILNFVCALYKCGMMVVYKKMNNLKNKH
jgi:hypothetical protein